MKVGSLVECIEEFSSIRKYFEITPVVGEVYTVRDIKTYEGITGIKLEEIVNKPQHYDQSYGEVVFDIRKFREIQPPINLTELFEEILVQNT